jgi:hypothetical protein
MMVWKIRILLRNKEENEYVLMLVEIGELRGITVIL